MSSGSIASAYGRESDERSEPQRGAARRILQQQLGALAYLAGSVARAQTRT